jgi:hypothetical protein
LLLLGCFISVPSTNIMDKRIPLLIERLIESDTCKRK